MPNSHHPLVVWTDKGLYCEAGGFYIDPHRAVDLAIVTHAHSDHARRGSKMYVCARSGSELLRTRLGKSISVDAWGYGDVHKLGEVLVSLHPAGHILGSAQVRIQRGDDVWLASGDYKRDHDPSCEPFESVQCDTFITEATFGTPRYRWEKDVAHGELISHWWSEARRSGKNCILFGYSLGKAQRILAELAPHAPRAVLIHSTMKELTECYRQQGRTLAPTDCLQSKLSSLVDGEALAGEMILAPPSIVRDFGPKLGRFETAFASGWMQGQGGFRTSQYDRGFVMSDHADWDDLNRTIQETGAKRVFVQHRSGALIRHLRQQGIAAHPIDVLTPSGYPFWGGEVQALI
jgi:putative mRNA 3-end processing factor